MALEASEIAVRIRLLGGSAFEKEASGASKSLESLGAAGKKANAGIIAGGSSAHTVLDKTGTKLKKVGSQVTNLGRSLTAAGIPLAYLGYQSVKASSQFGQAMTLLVTQANMPRKSLAGLSAQVLKLAPQFGATSLAAAQALYPIESIGLRGSKAINALKASMLGSAVGLDSLENTADAVTTVMASKIKGAGGPVEAMSIMDRAIGLGKMHLVDLTDSFKSQIVPMAAAFGLNFKQIVSAGAALTGVGTPASSAMARMRLSLTSMVSPTASGAKAMQAMGLNQFQLASDLNSPGGLLTALHDLKTHTEGMSKLQSNNLIAQIFGKSRGMGNIATLLNVLPKMDQIYSTVMQTTPATLMTHFGETQQTTAFKLNQAKAAFYNAMIQLGNALTKNLLPLLPRLVHGLTAVVNWFGRLSPGMQKFLFYLGAAIVVGGPIALFVGGLITVAGHLATFIGWLTKSEVAMGAGGLEGAISGLRVGFLGLLGPLGLLAGTIMLATNPKISGPIGRFEDKVAGFFAGDSHFGANNSGNQWGRFAGFNTPPPGYAAFLKSHASQVQYDMPLLNQWWATRKEPAQLTQPVSGLRGSQKFLGNLGSTITGIGQEMGFTVQVPVSIDGKVVAQAIATVNRKSMNRR